MDEDVFDLYNLPEIVILNISRFLSPEDVIRWSRTCSYFHGLLPRFTAMVGKPFHVIGPRIFEGDGKEVYFTGSPLKCRIRRLNMFIKWVDQGWGNEKGNVWVSLMRDGEPISVNGQPFGICKHHMKEQHVELLNHPVVAKAEPGDYYQFTRLIGAGGGHELTVKKFIAVVELVS